MSGWHVPGAGTISLEIIFCGIVEGYPGAAALVFEGRFGQRELTPFGFVSWFSIGSVLEGSR